MYISIEYGARTSRSADSHSDSGITCVFHRHFTEKTRTHTYTKRKRKTSRFLMAVLSVSSR